jgi:hypothetical protein
MTKPPIKNQAILKIKRKSDIFNPINSQYYLI